MKNSVDLKLIKTGIAGFDDVILKGGIPRYSLNLIAGQPGGGKTITSSQILFTNCNEDNKGILFSTVSEPPIKLLRYLQQFTFFESKKFNSSIKIVDMSKVLHKDDPDWIIKFIMQKIEEFEAGIVVIDSFKAISGLFSNPSYERRFIYDLSSELILSQCTSFFVGEYSPDEITKESVFAIADSIILISTDVKGYLRRHYIEVLKMRGVEYFAGKHRLTIDSSGITVYPRLKPEPVSISDIFPLSVNRISTGTQGLDKMTGGGVYEGSSSLIVGPSGVGKTILSLHFLNEGAKKGKKGLFISFEEVPQKLVRTAKSSGIDLEKLISEKKMSILYYSPIELSIDAFHKELLSLVEKEEPEIIVIDSISDISITIADPTHLKNYLFSMITHLGRQGITCLFTSEIEKEDSSITASRLSVVIDNIFILDYKKEEDKMKKTISVLKTRSLDHDKGIFEYEITDSGIKI
ncbi:MAG: ATPase domain-containing protein [bacterium]